VLDTIDGRIGVLTELILRSQCGYLVRDDVPQQECDDLSTPGSRGFQMTKRFRPPAEPGFARPEPKRA
jgi:hypothetical protein